MFTTLVPEHGNREHIIIGKNESSSGEEFWEVGCGMSHFPVEDFPIDELNRYEGSADDVEESTLPFCARCKDRVHTGFLFKAEASWLDKRRP